MATFQHTPPFGGAFARRFTRFSGLYFDEFATNSAWLRETAVIQLPAIVDVDSIVLKGEFRAHPAARGIERGFPGLDVFLNGRKVSSIQPGAAGSWEARMALDPASARIPPVLSLQMRGTGLTNALAWLGRVTRLGPIQRYRAQNKNRQLRIRSIESGAGEPIYDFSKRESPYSAVFARDHSRTGMNIVGFFTADLGIGESARCMARAADAASIATCLVPLRLNCRNRLGDTTFSARLQDSNPHGVNVFHVDPPVARDIDHHHGEAFRRDKYNIGFFAWELPEFPEAWMSSLDYFDEIWCPSDFVRESIALRAHFPVLTMPHAIGFERPGGGAALVIKVQNADANAGDFAALSAAVADLPGTVIISETLSRADVYALEAACDCFVSLHRSEGFGLAVAESMYLGKPVIATGWSATSEYLNHENGLPVRFSLVKLGEDHGPYAKGSTWAEPDVGHAAELMRRIASDSADASRIGAAARRTMEERFSPSVIGARYRRRLETIASQ